MTLKAEKFEELLTTELTSSLDPQRGKAIAAFRTHLAMEAENPALAGSLKNQPKEISRKEMWFWSSVPSIAAACLAVVVMLKLANSGNPSTGSAGAGQVAKQIYLTPSVEQARVITQQEKGAIVVNAGVPQRRINEKTETTTQWQDDQAIYRLSQPEGTSVRYEQVKPF
jgi:hypothetical protein